MNVFLKKIRKSQEQGGALPPLRPPLTQPQHPPFFRGLGAIFNFFARPKRLRRRSGRGSIFYVITFIFIFAGVSVTLAFLWLIEYDQQNYTNELNAKYSLVANARLLYLSGVISRRELEEQTRNYKMSPILAPGQIRRVLFRGEVLARVEANNGLVEIISLGRRIFLNLIFDGRVYLYEDPEYQSYRYVMMKLIAVAIVCVLVLLYIFIFKKLRPLAALRREIDKFAANRLDEIQKIRTGNDEISQVASAFYRATQQIRSLNKSRQFFIRNIMHELKTPITKGLITLEMMEESKYKNRLAGVFSRLEILINEFAAIEQLSSGQAFLNRQKYKILDLIDEAKEIAMNEDRGVELVLGEGFFVNVDFRLFATALKNMIDNALKYSTDGQVKIEVEPGRIGFKNRGLGLDKDLDFYTQAFTQGEPARNFAGAATAAAGGTAAGSGGAKNPSFGLGLYIVATILAAHGLGLEYEFIPDETGDKSGEKSGGELGLNCFYFTGLESIRD